MKENMSILKIHAGCGSHLLPGWINCDIKGDVDVIWDLSDKAPFSYNSVDYIFCEHVLEHFTLDDGVRILEKFRKVLKPGSKLRLAVPDLDSCIDSYKSGYGFKFRNKHQPGLSNLRINAEYINKCFREHGHKFLYNSEALFYSLARAGFIDVCSYDPLESNDKQLRGLERRIKGETSSQHSLCVEATKKVPKHASNG